jgi:hypothetical protein
VLFGFGFMVEDCYQFFEQVMVGFVVAVVEVVVFVVG